MSPHIFPTTVFGAALLLCDLRAQSAAAPAAPAHSHTPAAGTHTHATVVLDQFVTSASPFLRNQVDLAQATTVLSGHSLLLKRQATLGETLSAEPGITATSFGPGASRPIIRGLGGDRVRLLENSVATLDASITSPDHAVSIEPLLVDRIEVVRGPASLLYGSNAVGGAVNVITHRIETDLPTEPVRGGAELRYGTAADELAGGAVVDIAHFIAPERALVLHLDGFRRSSHDVRVPQFAESARLRAEETAAAREHGEDPPVFVEGRVPNTALDATSAAVGLSFVSEAFHVGASYSGIDSNYGVPGHAHAAEGGAGVRVDLRQRRTDVQGEWHADTGWLRGARVKFGHAQYRHAEIEPDGVVGTLFRNRGYDARMELLHAPTSAWSGATGVQSMQSDFSATGDEAFLPASKTRSHALFAFEELVHGALAWQFGARLERSTVSTEDRRRRRELPWSAAAGVVWKIDPVHAVAVSLTQTARAPNAQELFADGPHAGTQAFEIGNASLRKERSVGLEASLRRRTGFVTGALTAYTNDFDGYIFEQPTGEYFAETATGWQPQSSPELGEEALPVYRYVQRDARFWGAELETIWHLHAGKDRQLDLRFAADFTRARGGGQWLPRIPAPRLTAGFFWAHAGWSAGAESQWTLKQNRVAPNEIPSPGYALVDAHITRTWTAAGLQWETFVRATNLTDAEARPHTSFVKEQVPLAGRAVTAGVRLTF